MRKYIRDTKQAGAIPIVCSPIPRNDWKNGKVLRSTESYAKWAREVALAEGALFIDLNDIIAARYEGMGADKVRPFFPVDHTHTNLDGAKLNASIVMENLVKLKVPKLQKYVKK
jgi:lysophospholipase L1-like esterase